MNSLTLKRGLKGLMGKLCLNLSVTLFISIGTFLPVSAQITQALSTLSHTFSYALKSSDELEIDLIINDSDVAYLFEVDMKLASSVVFSEEATVNVELVGSFPLSPGDYSLTAELNSKRDSVLVLFKAPISSYTANDSIDIFRIKVTLNNKGVTLPGTLSLDGATGAVCIFETAQFIGFKTNPHTSATTFPTLRIQGNPVKGHLRAQLAEPATAEDRFYLINLSTGEKQAVDAIGEHIDAEVYNWPEGVYLLAWYQKGALKEHRKVIINR